MKPMLVITRGLPASGKTTWARRWVAEDEARRVRVNRDDLRDNLYGKPAPLSYEHEKAITAAQQEAVRGLLLARRSVVVDDTHLRSKYVRAWEEIAYDCGADFRVVDHFLHVPPEECVRRDGAREGRRVGPEVIWDMSSRFRNSLVSEKDEKAEEPWVYVPDVGKLAAWIVDIDGTLALHHDRSPYDYTRVHEDEPNLPVCQLVDVLRGSGLVIIVVSGREESCRNATLVWLRNHVGQPHDLFMRATGDRRDDARVKREIFQREIAPHYNVLGVLDDRNRVVRMWRSLGLLCCQVAPGAF